MTLAGITSGRTGRKTYILFLAATVIAPLALHLVEQIVILFLYPSAGPGFRASLDLLLVFLQFLSVLLIINILAANVILSIRRLHDIGYSGLWVIGIVMLSALTALSLVFGVVLVLSQIVLAVIPGERDDNVYGPIPSGRLI